MTTTNNALRPTSTAKAPRGRDLTVRCSIQPPARIWVLAVSGASSAGAGASGTLRPLLMPPMFGVASRHVVSENTKAAASSAETTARRLMPGHMRAEGSGSERGLPCRRRTLCTTPPVLRIRGAASQQGGRRVFEERVSGFRMRAVLGELPPTGVRFVNRSRPSGAAAMGRRGDHRAVAGSVGVVMASDLEMGRRSAYFVASGPQTAVAGSRQRRGRRARLRRLCQRRGSL